MTSILIVDDEPFICDILSDAFIGLGYETRTAGTIKEALAAGGSKRFDVVFLDVNLPDGSGLHVLSELREGPGKPEIIIMTGCGDADGAELALKFGAWDYFEKPATVDHFTLTLQRAIKFREQSRSSQGPVLLDHAGVIGESPAIRACLGKVARTAATQANVLITGETGTGKELFANQIHRNSPRSEKPFIVVDCACLPEELVESVLFGHERGAFTGADRHHPGLIRQANTGTLFLDEIGEIPPATQKRLLRVLQEHRFRPVGSVREEVSDFRLMAATNRDLDEMVREGTFRQDLLYRLKTVTIELPPLRERVSDIQALAICFSNRLCRRFGIEEKGFSRDFFQVLEAWDWPGNVRELANIMELSVVEVYDESMLFAQHLPMELRAGFIKKSVGGPGGPYPDSTKYPPEQSRNEKTGENPTFRAYRTHELNRIEREYLRWLMRKAGRNKQKACRLAGLSRTRLFELMKKHSIGLKK